ncbi:MAG: hypothetical protein WBG86_02095 [Polyangiales bacterium]
MKTVVVLVGVFLVFAPRASAQEEVGTVSSTGTAAPATTEAETPPADDEKKRSPYSKKVGGLLRIEGSVGPSSYDLDQFGSFGQGLDAPKVTGPEYALSAGVGLGGFVIAAAFRWANYSAFDLMKVGLDMQGIFRFIPYVHPMIRINLFYASTRNGSPFGAGLTNVDSAGGGATLGAGIRIPVVRWISIALTFDWSVIGLAMKGDLADGTRETGGVSGQQLTGTFAVTFQFIGVRRGD